jgi:hypothetical protein
MSLLGSQVYANPTKSLWASSSGGGGGSYPRDASFNSVTIDPSGGVFPLTLGLGATSNIMGIRRTEAGVPTDYILFDPVNTEMDLSNVATINGAPYFPTITSTTTNDLGGDPVPLAPSRIVLNSSSFTAPANGKLTMTAYANFTCATSNIANGVMNFEIDGTPGVSSAWFGASASTQTTSAAVCEVFSVSGGDVLTITPVASIPVGGTGASGDFEAFGSRTTLQFTTL